MEWSYAGIKTGIRLDPSPGKNNIFAQVFFDRCVNTLNGESMSLQQTEQEQLLTHMCEARLPHHMYKTLTMDQLPKANSSNYSTLKIKSHV